MAADFERVQEFQNGIAGDENGRSFIDVVNDHMLVYSKVCTDCKENEPYTAFHRMLRSLAWDAFEQLDLLKGFLIEMQEATRIEATNDPT